MTSVITALPNNLNLSRIKTENRKAIPRYKYVGTRTIWSNQVFKTELHYLPFPRKRLIAGGLDHPMYVPTQNNSVQQQLKVQLGRSIRIWQQ